MILILDNASFLFSIIVIRHDAAWTYLSWKVWRCNAINNIKSFISLNSRVQCFSFAFQFGHVFPVTPSVCLSVSSIPYKVWPTLHSVAHLVTTDPHRTWLCCCKVCQSLQQTVNSYNQMQVKKYKHQIIVAVSLNVECHVR